MKTACQTLKVRLIFPPVLDFSDFDKSFIVKTDALCVSLGAVLTQRNDDGKTYHIQYANRITTDTEKKFLTCEREALAVAFVLKKFRVDLSYSIPFSFITDHQALRCTFQKKNVCRIEDWSGKQNASANYLSRINDGVTVEERYEEGDLICMAFSVEKFYKLKTRLVSSSSYQMGFCISDFDLDKRQNIWRNAKRFAVWGKSLFCVVQ